MKKYRLIPVLLAGIVLLISCDQSEIEGSNGKYENGAFVLNEGTYGNSNASVSFIDFEADTIINDIFQAVNNRPVGDVLQSAYSTSDKVFLVVNNSNKVEVVAKGDFTEETTIEGLDQPRYMAVANGKGYISQWGVGGSVAVVNLSSYQVQKTIVSGTGPEGMAVINGKVVVANGGGWDLDSTLSVINTAADTILKKIAVGYNPKEMAADSDGNLWVLCFGHIVYNPDWSIGKEFPSKLVKVSSADFSVQKEILIGESVHPQHLDISPDRKTLYVGGGFGFAGIYSVMATASVFPSSPLIRGYFYGFNVDPESGDIYTCEAPDFVNPGTVKIWSKEGVALKEYQPGIGPNGLVF